MLELRIIRLDMSMNALQEAACAAFEAMKQDDQLNVLQRDGIYIGKLRREGGTILLYQYGTIYVQITYIRHRVEVKEIHCFADTTILDRYFTSDGFEVGEGT